MNEQEWSVVMLAMALISTILGVWIGSRMGLVGLLLGTFLVAATSQMPFLYDEGDTWLSALATFAVGLLVFEGTAFGAMVVRHLALARSGRDTRLPLRWPTKTLIRIGG